MLLHHDFLHHFSRFVHARAKCSGVRSPFFRIYNSGHDGATEDCSDRSSHVGRLPRLYSKGELYGSSKAVTAPINETYLSWLEYLYSLLYRVEVIFERDVATPWSNISASSIGINEQIRGTCKCAYCPSLNIELVLVGQGIK
jgi:hypothetical protein